YLLISKAKINTTNNHIYIYMYLFLITCMSILSVLINDSKLLANFRDNFYWIISFLPLILNVDFKEYNNKIFNTLMISSILSSIILIYSNFDSGNEYFRSEGFINHSNLAAALLLISLTVSIGRLIESKN